MMFVGREKTYRRLGAIGPRIHWRELYLGDRVRLGVVRDFEATYMDCQCWEAYHQKTWKQVRWSRGEAEQALDWIDALQEYKKRQEKRGW